MPAVQIIGQMDQKLQIRCRSPGGHIRAAGAMMVEVAKEESREP